MEALIRFGICTKSMILWENMLQRYALFIRMYYLCKQNLKLYGKEIACIDGNNAVCLVGKRAV
ncbi:hypothetical protein HMPREF9135_2290 [Segatella baroniae F0067]|uniref:Uncharacterized protein n=1 Tax=Segatella baroniae F0067 TaxID=1115809 RepID=U2NND9_9BACT|nr:hypothetical protein HMPREF9135_2290 [Segatella baroniae F0067]